MNRIETPDLPEPSDPPVRFVSVLGTTVGYTEEGPTSGPRLLAVPGVPGGAPHFRYLAPVLAARLRVHRLELPGFGSNTGAVWHDYSPGGRAALVNGFAEAMGIRRFAVLGHSMGGPAAVATAALHPDRVTALALLASVGLRRHRGMVIPPPVARVLIELSRLPVLRGYMLRRVQAMYRKLGFPGTDELTPRLVRVHARHVAAMDFLRARTAARAVRCPAMVAWADDDPHIEPAIARELVDAIPKAEPVCFPTGGHDIQKFRAAELASVFLSLMDS
jgi:pimeloyl-ACP methyl ester carboxylesterase